MLASSVPLFQAAAANLNPWTEAKVDTENPERGPPLIISGETEMAQMPGRGHALTFDTTWRQVDTALTFVQRFA